MKVNKDNIHYVENLSFPPNKEIDSPILCGIKKNRDGTITTNAIRYINCPKCLNILNRKKCHVCGDILKLDEINNNDFYFSCKKHKDIAQARTEMFFIKNPDFTQW